MIVMIVKIGQIRFSHFLHTPAPPSPLLAVCCPLCDHGVHTQLSSNATAFIVFYTIGKNVMSGSVSCTPPAASTSGPHWMREKGP